MPRSTRLMLKSNRLGLVPAGGWLLVGGGFAISAILPAEPPFVTAPPRVAPASHTVYTAAFADARPPAVARPSVDAPPSTRAPTRPASAPAPESVAPAAIEPVAIAVLEEDRPLPGIARPATIKFALRSLPDVGTSEESERIVVRAPAPRDGTESPAYVAQVSTSAQGREAMPQVSPENERSGALLADAAAAMQVALPPVPVFTDEERGRLLALAPESMVVRIDGIAAGEVAVRLTDTRAVAVQLGDLLDLVAERMPAERYDQLRQSSASATFVTLDRLRDAGISVQYDAAYDELRMSV